MSKAGAMAAIGIIWMFSVAAVWATSPFNVPWWFNPLMFLIGLVVFLLAFPARNVEQKWHETFD